MQTISKEEFDKLCSEASDIRDCDDLMRETYSRQPLSQIHHACSADPIWTSTCNPNEPITFEARVLSVQYCLAYDGREFVELRLAYCPKCKILYCKHRMLGSFGQYK